MPIEEKNKQTVAKFPEARLWGNRVDPLSIRRGLQIWWSYGTNVMKVVAGNARDGAVTFRRGLSRRCV
jgi:hypothetical protein